MPERRASSSMPKEAAGDVERARNAPRLGHGGGQRLVGGVELPPH